MSCEHDLRIANDVMPLFKRGKALEIRVKDDRTLKIKTGDVLVFNRQVKRRVTAIRSYSDFFSMMRTEPPELIAPGVPVHEIMRRLSELYPRRDQQRRGVLVFGLAEL
ncbi:MAG: hypothetical protein JWN64_722 [Parcubacteria group bacterium]|nr:hypothetical protein [Parcubacteria group bacterium]